jgi:hypothetical protein
VPMILVNAQHRSEVEQLYYAWQKELQPSAIVTLPPIGASPDGRVSFSMVPKEFFEILRSNRISFEVASN